MFLEAIILGIIVGLVKGGRLSNIGYIDIRGTWFFVIGFILQIMIIAAKEFDFISNYSKWLFVLSVIFILFGLALNMNYKSFWIIMIGAILNYIVIFANGFKMPIYFEGLKLAGLETMIDGITSGDIINYTSLDTSVGWAKYLGKFIVVPKPYPLAKVISIGDILISLGIILFLNGEMNSSKLTMRNRMFKMGYRRKSRYRF